MMARKDGTANNYPPDTRGALCNAKADDNTKIAVVVSGRVFMQPLDCPFRLLDHILPLIKR